MRQAGQDDEDHRMTKMVPHRSLEDLEIGDGEPGLQSVGTERSQGNRKEAGDRADHTEDPVLWVH